MQIQKLAIDKTRHKSLGMRLTTSAQFIRQIDRVRQNETLASVRHPQPPYMRLLVFIFPGKASRTPVESTSFLKFLPGKHDIKGTQPVFSLYECI